MFIAVAAVDLLLLLLVAAALVVVEVKLRHRWVLLASDHRPGDVIGAYNVHPGTTFLENSSEPERLTGSALRLPFYLSYTVGQGLPNVHVSRHLGR